MKYLAAYALLALSGKKDINAADLKKVLGDAQIKAEDADINRLLEAVKGKSIHQLIAEGSKQIGSSAPAPSAAPVVKADAKKEVKEEPKKADKKQDKKKEAPPPAQEEEDFMAGGLFD